MTAPRPTGAHDLVEREEARPAPSLAASPRGTGEAGGEERTRGARGRARPEAHALPRRGGGVPPLSLEREEREENGEPDWAALAPRGFYGRFGKRLLNAALLVSCLPPALLLALPIALVNWAIFRDARRILYCQPRVGRRGRVFSIYKFRTMREAPADDFESWMRDGDRLRVTRFGRLLRNTHLDELPQLINVLRGEMDFIGPRPEMIEIDRWARERIPGFRERNALLPGITGYAQITHGYAGMDTALYQQKLAADQHYRAHLSLALDLDILLRTAVWMLRGRGWRRRGAPRPAADAGT